MSDSSELMQHSRLLFILEINVVFKCDPFLICVPLSLKLLLNNLQLEVPAELTAGFVSKA